MHLHDIIKQDNALWGKIKVCFVYHYMDGFLPQFMVPGHGIVFRRVVKHMCPCISCASVIYSLTLPMVRLLSSKTKASKDFRKPSKPCYVGIHLIALAKCWVLLDEYPCARVSVIFQGFLHHFVLAKLATSSIRVKAAATLGGINKAVIMTTTPLSVVHWL